MASSTETNRFVREVDKFMANYRKLLSSEYQNIVYNSGDNKLINDYEVAINRAGSLRGTIIATTGTWLAAKETYANITDTTSTVIGDAVDEIRSWFGYDPSGGLGAFQIPAVAVSAVWMAGIVAAAILMNNLMSRVFVQIEAAKLVRSGMPRDRAIQVASNALAPSIFAGVNKFLLLGGGLALFLMMRK